MKVHLLLQQNQVQIILLLTHLSGFFEFPYLSTKENFDDLGGSSNGISNPIDWTSSFIYYLKVNQSVFM